MYGNRLLDACIETAKQQYPAISLIKNKNIIYIIIENLNYLSVITT